MSVNQLILKNMKKNIKNYYLYIFALVFSSALYFSFVTLQFDPSMNDVEGSIKGGAAIKAASVLLVIIVSVFLIYANSLFTKRRSREIGLFQLIGMTKGRIFRLLTIENLLLYFGSLLIGIFSGFLVSKLMMMILYKVTGVSDVANLYFSTQALVQTLLVFIGIYLLIMVMNYLFIKRQSILSLFRVQSTSEEQVQKMSFFNIIIGILGIVLIASGYYVSSILFDGDFTTPAGLYGAMLYTLGAVVGGTYLFYKGSVSFLIYMMRKQKDGYLNIKEVMSLSSIMFRMKSNAFLLTIITTVSALAIGLLSLSYISYYSAEKTAVNYVPNHFSFIDEASVEQFKNELEKDQIDYNETKIEVVNAEVDLSHIQEETSDQVAASSNKLLIPFVSEKAIGQSDLSKNEIMLSVSSNIMEKFMPLKDSGEIDLFAKNNEVRLDYRGVKKESFVPLYFTKGGLQTAIVSDSLFKELKEEVNPEYQNQQGTYFGIDIQDSKNLEQANASFNKLNLNSDGPNESQLDTIKSQKTNMGLMMFIVGFLGLSFLVTSGCILYFKQMGESEDEISSYTILRKLGFTTSDLMKGLRAKQLFSFGIPLIVGMLHSYFAVQSGWFLFGGEVWTPMISVMVVYTILYSIFGVLSTFYSKKVVDDAL